jgi:DNA-binding CsgD family transcriptional regulator
VTFAWTYRPPTDVLAAVERALAAPPAGGVVVLGGPGTGKTALLRHLLDGAGARGRPTACVTGSVVGASVPFGAVIPLLGRAGPGAAAVEIVQATLAALARRAGRRGPLLLGVDDAHLLDPASSTLLARAAEAGSVVVLATERTEDGRPSPTSLTRLPPFPGAVVVTLPHLGPDEVAALAEATLGGPVSGPLARALWEHSQGSALLVRELLAGAHERGRLHLDAGRWEVAGRLADPARPAAVIEQRLASLTPGARRALELLALSEPLDVASGRALAGADALTELETRNLVVVDRLGRRTYLRCAHPFLRDVVCALVPPLRRHLHLDALAGALAVHGLRRLADEMRVAAWRAEIGGPVSAHGLGLAALQAVVAGDADGARHLLAGAGPEPTHHARLADGLALALSPPGADTRAAPDEAAGAWPHAAMSPEEQTLLLVAQLAVSCWVAGNVDDGHRLLDDAEAALAADDGPAADPPAAARRAAIGALRAQLLLLDDRFADAGAAAARVTADPAARPAARARALAVAGVVAALAGDGAGSLELGARSGALVHPDDGGDLQLLLTAHQAAAAALVVDGHTDEAVALIEGDVADVLTVGWNLVAVPCLWLLTDLHLHAGRIDAAGHTVERAADLLRAVPGEGRTAAHHQTRVLEAEVAARQGHAAVARDLLASVDAIPRAAMPAVVDRTRCRAGAVTALASGDRVQAARAFADLAAGARTSGNRLDELRALVDGALAGGGGAERIATLAAEAPGPLFDAAARAASALDGRSPTDLLAAVAALERAGAGAWAAEVATRVPRSAVLGQHLVALSRATVADAASRGVRHFHRSDADRSPALDHLGRRLADVLTPAERRVADLAAAGLTNPAIADRLVVSRRTVENHLHRAYTKLGVAGRHELSVLLAGRPPAPGHRQGQRGTERANRLPARPA